MTATTKTKRPVVAGRIVGSTHDNGHDQAYQTEPRGATIAGSSVIDAQAGKALAVWMYCVGARSLGVTQAAFDRRPDWRAA